MESSTRSLRVLLFAIAVANAALAFVYLAGPTGLTRSYSGMPLDGSHLYLATNVGALLLVLAGGALLAAFQPRLHSGIILVVLSALFALFLVGVVALARGQVGLWAIIPEMAYELIACVLLIRFHPSVFQVQNNVAEEFPQQMDRATIEKPPPPNS